MPEPHRYVRVDDADSIDPGALINVIVAGLTIAVPSDDVVELAELDFMFDGPPAPDSPRFIETHDAYTGRGVGWGQWVDNGDSTWSLIGLAAEIRREANTNA